MISIVDITIKRGDTRRHIFTIKDADGNVVDISGWSSFTLAVTSDKDPVNTDNEMGVIAGALITDGTDGRVGFTPTGNWDVGKYFYDAQAIDSNSEKITFVEGKYTIDQDRNKQ